MVDFGSFKLVSLLIERSYIYSTPNSCCDGNEGVDFITIVL